MPEGPKISRRVFLRGLALQGLSMVSVPCLSFARPRTEEQPFMYGINAYYLLVEAYRHVRRSPGRNRLAAVREYLEDRLRLPEIMDRTRINAIRYWAFNDYPSSSSIFLPGSTDAHLWQDRDHLDMEAFDVLGHVTMVLDSFGLQLVPVLSNYWPSYGGILMYLVWAGKLNIQEYTEALCSNSYNELYQRYCLEFFTCPAVQDVFRRHTGKVASMLSGFSSVRIIELMNEVRGKNPCSLANRPVAGNSMTSDIVADWLNRQADWLRRFFKSSGKMPAFSSGEEGWLEGPVKCTQAKNLKAGGQYYEGIDLLKNTRGKQGIDIASVHMYPHPAVETTGRTICGREFEDRRGWGYLAAESSQSGSKRYFETLADEWIATRACTLNGIPWYIGEMGWCWPGQEKASTGPERQAAVQERKHIYSHWTGLARHHNARGAFIWMLNGIEHSDPFYGLTRQELIAIM